MELLCSELSYNTGTTPYKKVHHTPYCRCVDMVYLFFREIKTRKCVYERVRHREAWKSSFHLLQIKYLRNNLGKSHCTGHGGDDSRSCLPAHLKSSRSMEIIILMNPEYFGLTFLRVSELMQTDFTKGCRRITFEKYGARFQWQAQEVTWQFMLAPLFLLLVLCKRLVYQCIYQKYPSADMRSTAHTNIND